MSPNYLSDMLRNLTGQSAQQLIHNKLIEKAKEILSTTNLSVSELHTSLVLNIRNLLISFSRARWMFRLWNSDIR